MSSFLIKQGTWKFSFMKWKSPRWITAFWYFSNSFDKNLSAFNAALTSIVIFTYGMLTEAARHCRYSLCWWIVENPVTFDTVGGRYVFSVIFTGCLVGLHFSQIWVNHLFWGRLDHVNSIFQSNTKWRKEKWTLWYVRVMLYLTKFWWILRLVYNWVEELVCLKLYHAFQ